MLRYVFILFVAVLAIFLYASIRTIQADNLGSGRWSTNVHKLVESVFHHDKHVFHVSQNMTVTQSRCSASDVTAMGGSSASAVSMDLSSTVPLDASFSLRSSLTEKQSWCRSGIFCPGSVCVASHCPHLQFKLEILTLISLAAGNDQLGRAL